MGKNLSIFNFKKIPRAFLLSAVIAFILELIVFSNGYLCADKSTLCIVHKAKMLKARKSDIIILGQSRSLAINGKKLEDSLGGRYSIYNYANPTLGTNLQYYLILKEYLQYHEKPKAILLTVPIEHIGLYEKHGIFRALGRGIEHQFLKRFCRYFNPLFMMLNVPFEEKWRSLRQYAELVMPSSNYRIFIKDRVTNKDLRKVIDRNILILESMDASNGQMLFYEDKIVSDKELSEKLPTGKKTGSIEDKNIEKFLQLANKEKIPVLFFLMPICKLRYEVMENLDWFNDIYAILNRYEKKYEYFNFWQANIKYEKKYFGDWSHLNKNGADKFNNELGTFLLRSSFFNSI